MTTSTAQEQQSTSTTRSTAPRAARPRPINAVARAYRVQHGDPARWTAHEHRVYAELGGIQ